MQKNFEPAHRFYSEAMIALANPYGSAFSDVRQSSVQNIKGMKDCLAQKPLENMKRSHETIKEMKEMLHKINNSRDAFTQCTETISKLMNKAPITTLEQHADLFHDESSDSSEKDDWEQIGSDEEIIG